MTLADAASSATARDATDNTRHTHPMESPNLARAAESAFEASPLRARALLGQCRELVRERLNRVIGEALEKLELDLMKLADQTHARTEQQVLLEAMSHLRKHRGQIAVAFDRSFLEVFDKRLDKPRQASVASTAELRLEDLKLVDDSAIESEIIVGQLAKKAKDGIDQDQLRGIRARIGHLLANEELPDDVNPIAPEAIIEALQRACDQIPAEFAVKSALLNAFQPYVAGGIGHVYADVNQCLIANHVLPRIRHQVRKAHDGSAQTAAPQQKPQGMDPATAARLGRTQPLRLDQLLAMGQMMRSGQMPIPGAAMPLHMSQAIATMAAGAAEMSAALGEAIMNGPPEVRSQVARMLSDPQRYAFEPAMQIPATPALLSSLSEMQATLADAPVNFLSALDGDLRAQAHPLDQLTIELVTVVFDFILNDKGLPQSVKAELSRLQIVAVKAAILDRTFFARRQHPMRQLLDRIAEAGTDPEVDTVPEGPFVSGLRAIVDDVVADFKDDLAVFTAAQERVEKLAAESVRVHEAELQTTAKQLEQQEQAEIAHASALAEVRRRIRRRTPDFVRDFLLEWWTRVLVDSYLKELQGEDSWTHRLGIVDALVWSVGALRKTEIAQLASMLPTLMRSVMRGMNAVAMPADARHAFFNQLMQAHTATINAAKGTTGESTLPDAQTAANDAAPEPPVEEPAAAAAAPLGGDYYLHAVKAMERGSLVEFVADAESVRAKLSWISPRQTIYLFTSANGGRSLSPDALAQSLRSGAARLVGETAGLMDRVVEAVVGPHSVPAA